MRNLIYTGVAAVCLLFASAAHADTIYDLLLTTTSGNVANGSGSFEINTPPLTGINQQSTYEATNTTGDILESLSFFINGQTFDLSDANNNTLKNTYVQFTSGLFDAVEYAGSEKDGQFTLSLSAAGLEFTYYDQANGDNASGTISIDSVTNVSAAPEPSSLALLGTGLLVGCVVLRKRFA